METKKSKAKEYTGSCQVDMTDLPPRSRTKRTAKAFSHEEKTELTNHAVDDSSDFPNR